MGQTSYVVQAWSPTGVECRSLMAADVLMAALTAVQKEDPMRTEAVLVIGPSGESTRLVRKVGKWGVVNEATFEVAQKEAMEPPRRPLVRPVPGTTRHHVKVEVDAREAVRRVKEAMAERGLTRDGFLVEKGRAEHGDEEVPDSPFGRWRVTFGREYPDGDPRKVSGEVRGVTRGREALKAALDHVAENLGTAFARDQDEALMESLKADGSTRWAGVVPIYHVGTDHPAGGNATVSTWGGEDTWKPLRKPGSRVLGKEPTIAIRKEPEVGPSETVDPEEPTLFRAWVPNVMETTYEAGTVEEAAEALVRDYGEDIRLAFPEAARESVSSVLVYVEDDEANWAEAKRVKVDLFTGKADRPEPITAEPDAEPDFEVPVEEEDAPDPAPLPDADQVEDLGDPGPEPEPVPVGREVVFLVTARGDEDFEGKAAALNATQAAVNFLVARTDVDLDQVDRIDLCAADGSPMGSLRQEELGRVVSRAKLERMTPAERAAAARVPKEVSEAAAKIPDYVAQAALMGHVDVRKAPTLVLVTPSVKESRTSVETDTIPE